MRFELSLSTIPPLCILLRSGYEASKGEEIILSSKYTTHGFIDIISVIELSNFFFFLSLCYRAKPASTIEVGRMINITLIEKRKQVARLVSICGGGGK